MKASDLIRRAHVALKKDRVSDETLGISLRMIREFDAEEERRESLLRAAKDRELMRVLYLLHMPCGPMVH